MTTPIAEARIRIRRLAAAADPTAGIAEARTLLSEVTTDAVFLTSAMDYFTKAMCAEDAANAANALLALSPPTPAVVGRALHALRTAGRDADASAASRNFFETANQAALTRPGIATAIKRLPAIGTYYDGGAQQQWLPYVMLGGTPCMQGPVLNTDAKGYRHTVLKDGTRFSLGDDPQVLGNAVIVGGSTVYGVGASSDAWTLPSLLSDDQWRYHNMGTRAYVLAQNTVGALFELTRLSPVRRIVLLAGWNDIAVLPRASVVPRGYGPLFSWNILCRTFNHVATHFPEADWPEHLRARYSTESSRHGEPAHHEVMDVLNTMLAAWRMIADQLGAELHYVLQPARNWIDRVPPPEEDEVCELLSPTESIEETNRLADWARSWYPEALETLCAEHAIPFTDANRLLERHPLRDTWLFVDPAHLTDQGHRVLAEILKETLDHEHQA